MVTLDLILEIFFPFSMFCYEYTAEVCMATDDTTRLWYKQYWAEIHKSKVLEKSAIEMNI